MSRRPMPICCDRAMSISHYTRTGKPAYFCPICGSTSRRRKQPQAEPVQEMTPSPEQPPAPPTPESGIPDTPTPPAIESQPTSKRGRPRVYGEEGGRQKAWKRRTKFETSEERKAYKAAWIKRKREQEREQKQDS